MVEKFAVGKHTLDVVRLADSASISIVVDVSDHLDPECVWTLTTEISEDGGTTWELFDVIGRAGGQLVDPRTGAVDEFASSQKTRQEGLCSMDGGKTWSKTRELTEPQRKQLLALPQKDLLEQRQPRPWASPQLRGVLTTNKAVMLGISMRAE